MWNRRPFMSASELEKLNDVTRHFSKALPEAPHQQRVETYWNTAMQQSNISSRAFEARRKEILKQVC
jgi:hypothetical protein